jgi:hypothetical protein
MLATMQSQHLPNSLSRWVGAEGYPYHVSRWKGCVEPSQGGNWSVGPTRYIVESIGLHSVAAGENLEATIQRFLNDKSEEGWEFVESHSSPDDPSTRLFVFRRVDID